MDAFRRNFKTEHEQFNGLGPFDALTARCRFFDPTSKSSSHLGMDQYLLIPFLVGWTSIYQLFWCSPGVQGFDPLPLVFFGLDVEQSLPRGAPKIHPDPRSALTWLPFLIQQTSTAQKDILHHFTIWVPRNLMKKNWVPRNLMVGRPRFLHYFMANHIVGWLGTISHYTLIFCWL